MHKELDLVIAARMAKLIVEDYEVKTQQQKMVHQTINDGGTGWKKQ